MTKCLIVSREAGFEVTGDAVFNPNTITIKKDVPYNPRPTPHTDNTTVEFTDSHPRVLSVDLLFDTYESGENVYTTYIKKLELGLKVRDPHSDRPEMLRPPHCAFQWGSFPAFVGVITSLGVKYTMFFNDGTPCRATASISMTEVVQSEQGDGTGVGEQAGRITTAGDAQRPDKAADALGISHRQLMEDNNMDTSSFVPGTPITRGET